MKEEFTLTLWFQTVIQASDRLWGVMVYAQDKILIKNSVFRLPLRIWHQKKIISWMFLIVHILENIILFTGSKMGQYMPRYRQPMVHSCFFLAPAIFLSNFLFLIKKIIPTTWWIYHQKYNFITRLRFELCDSYKKRCSVKETFEQTLWFLTKQVRKAK